MRERTGKIIKCLVCGKKKYLSPYKLVGRNRGLYCSRKCYQQTRKNGEIRKCLTCGNKIYQRKARQDDGKGKYCSKKCYYKDLSRKMKGRKQHLEARIKISEKRIGKLNPAYIHGKSGGYVEYKGLFHRWIKEQVRKRDKNQCKKCKSKKQILVHHKDFDKLNNDLNNLVTLCRKCHTAIHRNHA